jgi:DNA-binding IclR family transcriptional regulator
MKSGRRAKAEKTPNGLFAVDRATKLLAVLAGATGPLSLHRLADEMDCSVSTVHRLVVTLSPPGLVEREPQSGRVRLGLGVLRLASARQRQLQLPPLAEPFMEKLRGRHHETVSLWVRRGANALCLASLEATHELRQYVMPGTVAPLVDFGAKSRVLLAGLPDEELDEALRGAPLHLLGGSLARLKAEIRAVAADGVALVAPAADRKLHPKIALSLTPHISGVASPIRNDSGAIVGALAIAGPDSRFAPASMEAAAKDLHAAGADLSAQLGYAG